MRFLKRPIEVKMSAKQMVCIRDGSLYKYRGPYSVF